VLSDLRRWIIAARGRLQDQLEKALMGCGASPGRRTRRSLATVAFRQPYFPGHVHSTYAKLDVLSNDVLHGHFPGPLKFAVRMCAATREQPRCCKFRASRIAGPAVRKQSLRSIRVGMTRLRAPVSLIPRETLAERTSVQNPCHGSRHTSPNAKQKVTRLAMMGMNRLLR
jgi:hypothetical protein